MMNKSIILTTHDRLCDDVRSGFIANLEAVASTNDDWQVMNQRGHYSSLAIMTKLHAALLAAEYENCFIIEHDVLYPPGYFDRDPGELSYSRNGFFLTPEGFIERQSPPLSTLAGNRDRLLEGVEGLLREHFTRGKVKWMEFGLHEPGGCTFREYSIPFIDIRHGTNHTGKREGRTIEALPHWGHYLKLWDKLGGVPSCK